eukprot:TRINITY_DN2355_c0_g1_i1.p1 TRINITY_DN2355_c0_g1~~TRINITY_DN2355_c0_g1_i1.p1  ORF type:complete len:199 (+),score=64.56 TRINITY_DN2355_c0_g1_i1:88-597(+)
MPPPQQRAPSMELKEETELALAGQIEAHGEPTFLDPVICIVCGMHTFGPSVAVTSSCDHHFHRSCIEDALKRKSTECPCGAALPPGKEPLKDATLVHKRIMNAIDVECPQGCGSVMQFGDMHVHIHSAGGCPNTPFRCGNEGCDAVFLRAETDEHLGSCTRRRYCCGRS